MGPARLLAAFLVILAVAHEGHAQTEVEVSVRPLAGFRILSSQTRFGPLEFVGGLELTARTRDFGGLSAFRFLAPGSDMIGVTDTGSWFFGRIERDAQQRPVGFADVRLEPIAGTDGQPLGDKFDADAEGLAVRDGVATVGFERRHRIADFRIAPWAVGRPLRARDFLVPERELRRNAGFETLAFAPVDGPLKGALVAVTENSQDAAGNIFAAVLDGPRKGVFTVARHGDFRITDGAFLPDGDLLLLERRFSFATGVGMRLRRIDAAAIRPGALVDGEALYEADMRYNIDNMEGIDVWRRADGATMVSILSDDNQSLLQRNLYLEFRLVE
jgi:hypothetical protein